MIAFTVSYSRLVRILAAAVLRKAVFASANEVIASPCRGMLHSHPCNFPIPRVRSAAKDACNLRHLMANDALFIRGGGLPVASASHTTSQFSTVSTGRHLWSIPFLAAAFSFWTFPYTSLIFHTMVQWASQNTWIPDTDAKVSLQTNVVTQVVNGPVITSISVLFATLISMTFSTLHSRQVDVQKSFVLEIESLRQVEAILGLAIFEESLSESSRREVLTYLQQHNELLSSESSVGGVDFSIYKYPSEYIESSLQLVINWSIHLQAVSHHEYKEHLPFVLSQVRTNVQKMLDQRAYRWLSMTAMRFPAVHYLTLYLLAVSIGISFLVATDEADFIFLRGLPVRILWSVLISSFTALGVVCYDLSTIFAGAYHI
jgi:hypothetical protein